MCVKSTIAAPRAAAVWRGERKIIQSAVVGSCTTCLGETTRVPALVRGGINSSPQIYASFLICLLPRDVQHRHKVNLLRSIAARDAATSPPPFFKTAQQHILGPNPSKKPQKAGGAKKEQKGARLIKGEKKRMIFPPPSLLPSCFPSSSFAAANRA